MSTYLSLQTVKFYNSTTCSRFINFCPNINLVKLFICFCDGVWIQGYQQFRMTGLVKFLSKAVFPKNTKFTKNIIRILFRLQWRRLRHEFCCFPSSRGDWNPLRDDHWPNAGGQDPAECSRQWHYYPAGETYTNLAFINWLLRLYVPIFLSNLIHNLKRMLLMILKYI